MNTVQLQITAIPPPKISAIQSFNLEHPVIFYVYNQKVYKLVFYIYILVFCLLFISS